MAEFQDETLRAKIENEDRINNIFKPDVSDIPTKASNQFIDGSSPELSGSGEKTGNVVMTDGYMKSKNYEAGVSGWQIDAQGNAEFGAGKFRGDITGASGTFSGDLNAATITGGTINGTDITTNIITDSTYGFKGVFCKTIVTSYFGGMIYIDLAPTNGGLLNVSANWLSSGGNYLWLPGFNSTTVTSYYGVRKSGGNYQIQHHGSNIAGDISGIVAVYYTAFFNSLESGGW